MPTYEYVCRACEHEFEEFQSMSAASLKKCPSCGKNALERKIGIGAGIIFKGGGFYETDYRSESYKKAAEADSKPASDSGHVHSGTCGCGKKPADQCPSSAASSASSESPAKPARAKLTTSAASSKRSSAASSKPAPRKKTKA